MKPVLALTGPTAVGKSELGLRIAESLGAEIVSVDSRQVYRGLDVGTAKPTLDERQRVPHHFVDERDLDAPYSAGQFATDAWARIDEILARGRMPIVVGGSTLYLTALVEGLADLPSVPAALASELNREAHSESGRKALFDELSAADPAAAQTLDPSKSHRLARLVGVLRATGRPPSEAWARAAPPRHSFDVIVLDRPRDELYDRINRRVDRMLDNGLLDENRRLLELGATGAALRTIGYQEPQAYLRGEIGEADMVERLKRNSRRYAKRQLTWFRRSASYIWLDARTATPESVLERVNPRAI